MGKVVKKVTDFHDKIDPIGKKARNKVEDAVGLPRSNELWKTMTPDTSALDAATKMLEATLNGNKVTDWSGVYKAYISEKSTLENEMSQALSREKAIMAAGGLQSGSEGWQQRLDLISNDYNKKLSDLKNGSTYAALTNYFNSSGASGNMDDWLANQFADVKAVATRDASAAGNAAAEAEKVGDRQMAAALTEEEKRNSTRNPWLA